jgi:hypothetical protein
VYETVKVRGGRDHGGHEHVAHGVRDVRIRPSIRRIANPPPGRFKQGFATSLEFQPYLQSHADTFVNGPMVASDLVVAATK